MITNQDYEILYEIIKDVKFEKENFQTDDILPLTEKIKNVGLSNEIEEKIYNHFSSDSELNIVYNWSINQYFCRILQSIINNKKLKNVILNKLKNNVMNLINHKNGNFMIVECIKNLLSKDLQFIIKEIDNKIINLCCHKYGCRIIKNLITFFDKETSNIIINDIIENLDRLIKNQYGKYVIEHILYNKNINFYNIIILKIINNCKYYATNKKSIYILGKLLDITFNDNLIQNEIDKESLLLAKNNRMKLLKILSLETYLNLLINNYFGITIIKKLLSLNETKNNVSNYINNTSFFN